MPEIIKKVLADCAHTSLPNSRIPGLVLTARGCLLAYFEMRDGSGDWSAHGIGLMRSEDGGDTWEPFRAIAMSQHGETVNNPVMIACRNGDVHFLWQMDYGRCFHQISKDDGHSFSDPVEITQYVYGFRDQYPWKVMALGPGHGIELEDGRLLLSVWMANGKDVRAHSPSVAATLLSADSGGSWIPGKIIPDGGGVINPNEACLFQKSDGTVVINIRHMGDTFYRAVARSDDAHSFSEPVFDTALPDPICFGSICKLQNPQAHLSRGVVFSNCANFPCKENNFSHARTLLTLRLSADDGETWSYARLLDKYAGYSDVAVSQDGNWIYCLYEQETENTAQLGFHRLVFVKVPFSWLTADSLEN